VAAPTKKKGKSEWGGPFFQERAFRETKTHRRGRWLGDHGPLEWKLLNGIDLPPKKKKTLLGAALVGFGWGEKNKRAPNLQKSVDSDFQKARTSGYPGKRGYGTPPFQKNTLKNDTQLIVRITADWTKPRPGRGKIPKQKISENLFVVEPSSQGLILSKRHK